MVIQIVVTLVVYPPQAKEVSEVLGQPVQDQYLRYLPLDPVQVEQSLEEVLLSMESWILGAELVENLEIDHRTHF